MKKSILCCFTLFGFYTLVMAQETPPKQEPQESKEIQEEPQVEKEESTSYFYVGLTPVSIFNFKDLATSPKTYSGVLHSTSFGYMSYSKSKEWEYKINLYSDYFGDILGSSYKNSTGNTGKLMNYISINYSWAYTIDSWSNKNNRFLAGLTSRSITLMRNTPSLQNNALGVDILVTAMPRLKHYYFFERESDFFLVRWFVPKKGEISTSIGVAPNTMIYRSTSYSYKDANTIVGIANAADNTEFQFFTGYSAVLDFQYTAYFGENDHKLIYGFNWDMFNTGGKIEPLVASNYSFSIGLMFNLK